MIGNCLERIAGLAITLIVILADEDVNFNSGLLPVFSNQSKPIPNQEYHNFNNSSFSYRYKFPDGSIASEQGTFSISDDVVDVYGKGYFQFEIRKNNYKFNYTIAEDGVRAELSFLSSNGTEIVEKFVEPLNRTSINSHLTSGKFDIARNQLYSFSSYELGNAVVSIRLPLSEHHPSFGCTFNSQADSWSAFYCETYENRTESMIDSTPNRADSNWIVEQRRALIKTLAFENYHDGNGQYKFDYLFSTEMAIRENGKLDVDNSVSSIDGYISFNLSDRILHFNYTANATTYDVVLASESKDFADSYQEKCFQLQYEERDYPSDTKVYRNMNSFAYFEATRKLTYFKGEAFVRATINVSFRDPSKGWETYSLEFDINEAHSYGEQEQKHAAALPASVFVSMVG